MIYFQKCKKGQLFHDFCATKRPHCEFEEMVLLDQMLNTKVPKPRDEKPKSFIGVKFGLLLFLSLTIGALPSIPAPEIPACDCRKTTDFGAVQLDRLTVVTTR